jgi:hypothetical protein
MNDIEKVGVSELVNKLNIKEDENLELRKYNMQFRKSNIQAKLIIKHLLANRPDTYSGTDVMCNQKKMFNFSNAVDEAMEYLKEEINENGI